MIATMLVALFAAVALASAITLVDAVVRGRNAFRLLRGDLARIDSLRKVTVRFEGINSRAPMPALRAVPVNQRARRSAQAPAPLRAAA